jgi:glutathione S-transferase
VLTLYDAARCPYCARVRITLAEKGIEYETVEIDLSDRPDWIWEKNPLGKVPIIEEDGFLLPESEVIMEYLEERRPEPALLPADPVARALSRLAVHRFDNALGDAYYAFRRGEDGARERLEGCITRLARRVSSEFGFVEIAYLPWVIRLRDVLGYELPERIAARLQEVSSRPSVAAELETVASFA